MSRLKDVFDYFSGSFSGSDAYLNEACDVKFDQEGFKCFIEGEKQPLHTQQYRTNPFIETKKVKSEIECPERKLC